MRNSVALVLVAALITVSVGVLAAMGWPGYVMGALYGVSLWVMLFAGSYAQSRRSVVPAGAYAVAAAVAVALGYVFYRVGGENGAWWAVAFILSGVVLPLASSVVTRKPAREGARRGG